MFTCFYYHPLLFVSYQAVRLQILGRVKIILLNNVPLLRVQMNGVERSNHPWQIQNCLHVEVDLLMLLRPVTNKEMRKLRTKTTANA